ncbi:hypothetical protein Pmani_019575 [Petrolisthes manimaculis]|uniref:CST complex subunit STN1 n=1 Tax=Petrolisthes manimaculis TaxID=1843537 RepID=A0AAE1PI79_9EUCA|nr:hypothetical protein Pmani_019575 [Petrolisthes manimaculis]
MSKYVHKRFYLRELKYAEGKFYVCGEEVVRVDLYGTIVYLSLRLHVTILHLDDGTGIIHCAVFPKVKTGTQNTAGKEEPGDSLGSFLRRLVKPEPQLQLGDLVHIRGRLNVFRNQPQIIVNNLRLVDDVNEEWFRALEIETQKKRLG